MLIWIIQTSRWIGQEEGHEHQGDEVQERGHPDTPAPVASQVRKRWPDDVAQPTERFQRRLSISIAVSSFKKVAA